MPGTAIRTTDRRTWPRVLRAAIVTVGVLAGSAFLVLWLFPAGCNLGRDPAVYRWTCLFPGLLVSVPAVVAVLLSVFTLVNRRLKRPLPDGWLATVLAVGVLTHAVLLGWVYVALGAAYWRIFLYDVLFLPQPFLAGAASAAAYWIALHWEAIFRREPHRLT